MRERESTQRQVSHESLGSEHLGPGLFGTFDEFNSLITVTQMGSVMKIKDNNILGEYWLKLPNFSQLYSYL